MRGNLGRLRWRRDSRRSLDVRARQHVNPLGLFFEEHHGQMPEVPPGTPVEVEVGCAEAQFLFERAAIEPSRHYVGLEVRSHLVDWVNEHARVTDAPVTAVLANANHHLVHLLRDFDVARVYLNFPDPWFKRRHAKRRMVDETLIRDIHRILRPGGEVFVQTDVWHLALASLEALQRCDDLYENRAGEWRFWRQANPFGARSWREWHCEQTNAKIWRLLFAARDIPERLDC